MKNFMERLGVTTDEKYLTIDGELFTFEIYKKLLGVDDYLLGEFEDEFTLIKLGNTIYSDGEWDIDDIPSEFYNKSTLKLTQLREWEIKKLSEFYTKYPEFDLEVFCELELAVLAIIDEIDYRNYLK